jgi:hypothetical protein
MEPDMGATEGFPCFGGYPKGLNLPLQYRFG